MNLKLKQIQYPANGEPAGESTPIEIKIPRITDEDFRTRLQEIHETYGIIRDNRTGCAFEIAIVNKSQLKNGAILMPSTMFSSLTQNVGNAIELAAHGAATPETARVYIAFPGNGKSDGLSRQDRQYLAHTGRFTRDGEALDSISALARALDQEDIAIKSISANAEAGRFGLGIMAALPPNTVTSVYLNGLPGICPPLDGTYMDAMMREDVEDQKKRREEDLQEKYKVNDRTIREARSSLPQIYQRRVDYFFQLLPIYLRAMPNLHASISGFGGHHELQFPETHAALQDTLTALKRQNGAKVTFQFGKLSKLHRMDECQYFGQIVTEELRKASNQCTIQLLIDPVGCLDFHTSSPSKRWAAEKYALMIEQSEKPCIVGAFKEQPAQPSSHEDEGKPLEIFCCYARKDEEMLNLLKIYLMPFRREGRFTIWSDTDLNAGVQWEEVLHKHLESADIILLLISPDFMASDYCYSYEMTRAIERHDDGDAVVIPILLRPTLWQDAPFAKLQMIPKNAKPVSQWPDSDEAFNNIVMRVNQVVSERLKLNR